MYLDGELPFEESDKYIMPKTWIDESGITQDSRGNDIRPQSFEVETWSTFELIDTSGSYNEGFQYYLEKGTHEFTMSLSRGIFAIANITLYNTEDLKTFNDSKEELGNYNNTGFYTKIQAEEPVLKSDPSIIAKYDRSSYLTEPSDPTKVKLNTIGEYNWQYNGQTITWDFEVPEDGLYKVGVKARQNLLRGLFVSRRITIDGKVPYKELDSAKFDFNPRWQMVTLQDENGEELLFQLEAGKHTISMEVITGQMAEVMRDLQETIYTLNYMYRKILMITGPDPDQYRDYYLDREIPEFVDAFQLAVDSLWQQRDKIVEITGEKGSETAILETLALQIEGFLDEPKTVKKRLTSYKNNIAALSGWALRLKDQPLEIDYIVVASQEYKIPNKIKSNFFKNISFQFRAFLGSFTEDYTAFQDEYDEELALDVWVGLGRDQVQIVKRMVDDYFIPEYGVPVNVNLVQQGLIQATLAGVGPEIALLVPAAEPVNLAARGALYDISQFDDFYEVAKRFQPNAIEPYAFEGGYYGIPVTEGFQMMFYRKDIFAELGIEPPKTWDELTAIIPIIQRKNMQIGLPAIAMQPGAASIANNSIFQILLYQKGEEYYNDKRTQTNFDSPIALEAFIDWTDFYTKYDFPMEYDFYSRFRTGEMPLAIDAYINYNKLTVAAPELKNLWEMVPIPGTVKEDGSIDNTCVGLGTAAIMFNKTVDKEAGWNFLKWWTSSEIQSEFGRSIEALMGPAARYDTANIEAMKLLPWTKKEQELLLSQWNTIDQIPQIPATYYVFRNVYNAFRKVKFEGTNPREALFFYNRDINKEIIRKRLEFGLDIE